MKLLFSLLFLSLMLDASAQCEYSVVQYNKETQKATLESFPVAIDLIETPFNARIVLASFTRTGDQYFLELEITEDSSTKDLKPICFEAGTRLSFSLKNNSITSIAQIEDKICGVKSYDRKTGYTTVSNYANFVITQHAYDILIKSEIILMKIISEDYEETFVLKDELEDMVDGEIAVTHPSRFFIEGIECMTNPKFE